jgi:hypothetical protein
MKRRVPVAVLPVIALVVLAGTGEATSAATGESNVTRGVPWTGSPGVTVSVATLEGRQRAEDRRRAGQPSVIREKPEPGEQGPKTKLQGPAAPQQRVGQAAITPDSSLTAGTSFLGAQVSESGFVPPDSMGSVGPSQALVSVNGRIRVFDKQTGNMGGLDVTDSVFWASVRNGTQPTDPGVEYDRLSGRWIVTAVNEESTNNRVMVAVSSGSTITNQSSFTFYFFNQNSPSPVGATALFADYPQMAVDENAIYIGDNEFTSSSGSFSRTSAYVIRKSSVLGGGPIVVTAFRGLAIGGGQGPFSPQPAQDMDPNVNQGYIVGVDNAVFGQLDIRRISDPGGTPSISGNLIVAVPTTAEPLKVPAQGSPHPLDSLDDRLFEAMVGRAPDGSLSLWTAHNIRVNSSGVGSSTGDRDGSRWYQLGTLSTTPTLLQSGTLFDTAAPNPRNFWIPSIAMNGQGSASLNTSVAGSAEHAEIAGSGHLVTDATGTTEPPDTLQTSSSNYNIGNSNGVLRWGDYSQTVVDPNDNMTFWTFQEYANSTNSWGVRVIKLKPPPPATPTSASPTPIDPGVASQPVVITGTSDSGSGFFDPGSDPGGPGYPSHIGASVSGGVTVNSVTYTDPTHVTLDVNTIGATSGSKDVTITNPDGQSTTGFNVLVVGSDVTPPAPPTINGTIPASPANDNSPKVFGAAEGGSTVQLYTDPACTSGPVGSGSAAQFASPGVGLTTPVADNSTTTFYATATDASNNTSACSSSSVTYVEDSSLPVAPTLNGTTPSSPANDNSPKVFGSAEAGSTVKLYTNASCTGSPAATGSAATLSSPGIVVSVADDSTTAFHATATDVSNNTSACSPSSVTYVEDSTPPAAPALNGTTPTSPANNNSPEVFGSAETGSTVKLYTNASCTGSPVATGSAATFSSPGIVVSVADDSSTTFHATATDASNNTSGCSSSSVIYVEDSTPPAMPSSLAVAPTSPANDNGPVVSGTSGAGTTVNLYRAATTSDCTVGNLANIGPAATFASPGLSASVTDNTTTTIRATATDAADNTSGCSSSSVVYVEDSAAPQVTVDGGPSGSTGDTTPTFTFSATDSFPVGDTLTFLCSIDAGAPSFGGCSGPGNSDTPAGPLADGSHTFRVQATDVAGNSSVATRSFSVDTSKPAPVPPDTTITKGPKKKTSKRRPKFKFTSTQAGSTFQCKLDNGHFEACTSPFRPPSKLSPGKHVFRVQAIGPTGAIDPSPMVRKFKVLP